jgi:hypothetical protein
MGVERVDGDDWRGYGVDGDQPGCFAEIRFDSSGAIAGLPSIFGGYGYLDAGVPFEAQSEAGFQRVERLTGADRRILQRLTRRISRWLN